MPAIRATFATDGPKEKMYLFSWNKIPGNDSKRLLEFVKHNYNVDWIKTDKIEKINDGNIIRITTGKNFLTLKLNNEKTKINLEIDDCRTDEFIVEDGKRYENKKMGPFCFFRPEQKALSQIVMKRIAGEFGPEFDTISLYDFKKKLSSQALDGMKSMKETLETLQNAENVDELNGHNRLAEIQNYLVMLLSYIEAEEDFTLFPGLRKTAIRDKTWIYWAKKRGLYQAWYLFSWDETPGNDTARLKNFLKQSLGIDWVKPANIEKIDDGKTLRVSTENNFLSLKLNNEKTKINLEIDEKTKINLEINGVRMDKFIVKVENGKLNIYQA